MNSKDRPSRILVTCGGKIPSVELGAIIPLSQLQKRGLCEFRYQDDASLRLADIVWCDILLLVRGASNWNVLAAQWAKRHQRIVLGYWDDNFLAIPEYSLTYRYYSTSQVKANIGILFKLTDAFFTPNRKLAEKLAVLHGKEVKVLPGVHGTETFGRPKARNNRPPIVGYSAGPDHVKILNSLVGPFLAEVARTGADLRVHLMGPKPDFIGKLPVETVHTPYIQNYRDYLAIASTLDWDIGLAPQQESEFTTYKFYNKLLEYTYIGCAGIYTRIEPYLGVVEDGVTGLLVPNEVEAWKDAILRLLREPELRFRIASNAYEFVQNHHSMKVVAEQYAAAFAPFLTYRAPRIGKSYLIWQSQVGKLGATYKLATEYISMNGTRRFLLRAPRYAFSQLRRKLTHLGSRGGSR